MSDLNHSSSENDISDAAKTARPPGHRRKKGGSGSAYCAEMDHALNDTDIALDNCTDVSIFKNKALLSDVKESEYQWTVSGHAEGVDIIMTETGKFHGVSAMFSEEASCNVLCQYDVQEMYDCYEIPGWGVRVVTAYGPLDFLLLGKRYVCDSKDPVKVSSTEFDDLWKNHKKSICGGSMKCMIGLSTSTVEGRAAKYTVAERKRAQEAVELIRKSGFYSPSTLADMVQNGGYKDCGLSRQDIERGVDMMGRPKGYWNGKLHDRKSGQVIVEELPPLTKLRQIVHCDIMFVHRKKHFVALCNPLNLAITVPIASTKTNDIARAIREVRAILAKRNLVIHALIHDPEKSIAKCSDIFPERYFICIATFESDK